MTPADLERLFGTSKPLIGMVHLLPLPGSPRYGGQLAAVEERAQKDVEALVGAGFDAVLVENFGDMPFYPDQVPVEAVAALTAICVKIRERTALPVGVNVLRNDARAAMAVAVAAGAQFIRVNVHTGAVVSDQGLLSGRAHETLRLRRSLQADVAIFADVAVKHSYPPAQIDLTELAADAVERGLADAVIVTGRRTGEVVAAEDLVQIREVLPQVPVLVGSGVSAANVQEVLSIADGAIVGTAIKLAGRTDNPVDPQRARDLITKAHSIAMQ